MFALTNAAIYVSIVSVLLLDLRVIRPGIPAGTIGHRREGSLDEVQQTEAIVEPDATHNYN